MEKFKNLQQKQAYMKDLVSFISLRDPRMVGSKLFHRDFSKPDYVIYEGYVETGKDRFVRFRKQTGETIETRSTKGWFLWEPFQEKPALKDTDLINQIIEGCRVLQFEHSQPDYYQLTEAIGAMVLDLMKTSHRKDELFTDMGL